MATIRFAPRTLRDTSAVLLDLQEHPAHLDPAGLPTPPPDPVRQQRAVVDGLGALLTTAGAGVGQATAVASPSMDLLVEHALGEGRSREDLEQLLQAMARQGVISAMAELSSAGRLSSLLIQERRLRGLHRIEEVIGDRASTVADLREAIIDQAWMFGGRYRSLPKKLAASVKRRIPVLLTRTDGAFHIVEVGPVHVPDLVVADGDRHDAGAAVTAAVARAVTQLQVLDESAAHLPDENQTRRALATVVVGHCGFATGADPRTVRQTLRTYSSHLAGIDVITYDELLEVAERVTMADQSDL